MQNIHLSLFVLFSSRRNDICSDKILLRNFCLLLQLHRCLKCPFRVRIILFRKFETKQYTHKISFCSSYGCSSHGIVRFAIRLALKIKIRASVQFPSASRILTRKTSLVHDLFLARRTYKSHINDLIQ